MKRKFKILTTPLLMVLVSLLFASCDESGFVRDLPGEYNLENTTPPVVLTNDVDVDRVTEKTAEVSGFIKSDGGVMVIKSGICWGKDTNPTIEQGFLSTNGPTQGTIPCVISNLDPETKYYFRAYAVNPTGISYGETRSFTTKTPVKVKIFSDNFNRANSGWIDVGDASSTIGSGWVVVQGRFRVENNYLGADNNSVAFYYNKDAQTVSGNGKSFVLKTDFKVLYPEDYLFCGVIINAQSVGKFYLLRINGRGALQLLSTADGGANWNLHLNTTAPVLGGNSYKLVIASDTPGIFGITIKSMNDIELYKNIITITDVVYEGGYAGYWSLAFGENQFDNFELAITK